MITIGTVLFDGFEVLDVFGPLQMYGLLGNRARLILISERPGLIRSSKGPAVASDSDFSSTGDLDVLLVPGGIGTRSEVNNRVMLKALADLSGRSRLVTTVCTGSALFAATGLLDGRKATSNKRALGWVKTQGPKVDWIAKARWVVDGKYYSSSGVSAGMDMTLAVIESLFDRPTSIEIADRAEYDWHEDSTWDPFAEKNGLI